LHDVASGSGNDADASRWISEWNGRFGRGEIEPGRRALKQRHAGVKVVGVLVPVGDRRSGDGNPGGRRFDERVHVCDRLQVRMLRQPHVSGHATT
jgi:hypothetical protein